MAMVHQSEGRRNAQGRPSWIVPALALLALCAAPSLAGTISVTWDPVSDADLAGYKVYYGTTPGSHAQFHDAGNTTSATLSNVTDCTLYYVAVRAYDTSRLESTADSNSVKGFPRPVVNSVSPGTLVQGESKTFTISGINFDAGVAGDATRPPARVKVSGAGLTVSNVRVSACGSMTATISASSTAAIGYSSLTVENPDLSFTDPANRPWVFGTLANAIQVVAASNDVTAPTVQSVSPVAGAKDVATSVRPTVTFSEGMQAGSITASTVYLVDSNGVVVTQAAGSPSLAGNVATITPAATLASGRVYSIRVKGGAAGAKDLAGNALASDYVQSPGFTTVIDATAPVTVMGSDPAAGASGIPTTYTTIRINYNRDISTLWLSLSRFELQQLFRVTYGGRPLYQTNTSPATENGGKTVVITLRSALSVGTSYRTEAGPISQKGRAALNRAGIPVGQLGSLWRTTPPWTTQAAVQSASSRTASSSQSLEIPADSSTVPEQNANVPVTSEFTVTFAQQVSPDRLGGGIFRILDSKGAEVVQSANPRLENGNRTVVLSPADPLDAGTTYRIVVRTGKTGVLLKQADGSWAPIGDSQLIIPIATEVSGSSQGPAVAP